MRRAIWAGIGVSIAAVLVVTTLALVTHFQASSPLQGQATLEFRDEQGREVTATKVLIDGNDWGSGGSISIKGLDIGSHTLIIFIGDAQYTKAFYFSGQDTVTIQLKSRITLNLSDSETSAAVDAIDVYVDGTFKGKTTQDGQLDLADIAPGRHRIGLDVPGAQGMVERYIDVGVENQASLTVDMPNPTFVTAVSPNYNFWHTNMTIDVTLKNMGNVNSQDTVVLVFVYFGENFTTYRDSDMLDFGNIAPGGISVTRTTETLDASFWESERIFAVVVDRWKYTLQSGTVAAEVYTPEALLTQLARQARQYLEQHPELVGKIANMFLSKLL